MIFDCEFRVYESCAAYLCVCRGGQDYGSLADFAEDVRNLCPVYDSVQKKLSAGSDFALVYRVGEDRTQFVD